MSKITVTTIAGQTSGSDANLVKIESGDTLQALSNATVGGTLGVTGETTLASHLNLGDGDIIKLGASADLQIQHTSTNSIIDDQGTGNFELRTNGTDIRITGNSGSDFMGRFISNGAASLYYDGSEKIATTTSGVNVTGNVVSNDGSNNARFQYDNNNQILIENDSAMNFYVNGSNSLKIDSAGHITQPLQPAFLVHPSTTQSNLPINTTTTIVFPVERFDNNSDFASNTFTAPVTGKYQLQANMRLDSVDKDYNNIQLYITTSNKGYYSIIQPAALATDAGYWWLAMTILADMDAGDTATVGIYISNNGAAQMDVDASSYFSGYLVA